MCGLSFPCDENLLVGLDSADDAGVYKVTDEIAIIQTVDFFTPVTDDPFSFGQIAAANALSDVYAMGGIPKTAMNLVAFPIKEMDLSVLRSILEGGLDKMREAGAVLVGGHSIEDKELKYGLSVTGFIHPDRILTKKNIRPGDRLILTKPVGTGIMITAMKAGLVSETLEKQVIKLMAELNKNAALAMNDFPVHACTDITGFGLLGHLAEMVQGSGYSVSISADKVPLIPEAVDFASMGLIPAGAYRNLEFRENMIEFSKNLTRIMPYLLFDPQTSGGLLICIAPESADDLCKALRQKGIEPADIGRVCTRKNEAGREIIKVE
ncbi:Selenide, water dikinase [Desulfonema limicola]|uniref:Selenide, water dikinase n=1 Tax=Desulfonema limicola TaxID=45656 RepID=A0A975GIE8_9BACT|nr:Selenide, water dikinase [Desulfonema limicola]